MPDRRNQSTVPEKFARALLATTCLTAASGIAAADTVIEGQGGAPLDFANNFAQAYLLPLGTTIVTGTVSISDTNDFFEFQGLVAESAFSFQIPQITCCEGLIANIYNSSYEGLDGGGVSMAGRTLSGTVPSDGNLIVQFYVNAENAERAYEIDLVSGTSPSPEPATLPAAGLALAGALAWRRKRNLKG
jgi:MYXO-CTERM domain-containing protein